MSYELAHYTSAALRAPERLKKGQDTGKLSKTTKSFLLQLRADMHFFQQSEFINCETPAG